MQEATRSKKALAPGEHIPAHDKATPQNVEARHDKHWLRRPSTGGGEARPEYVPFAKALRVAMLKNKLSASEVARRIWGVSTDSRGYEVARNRDRIGHYLSGTSYPEPENLAKLAEAVGVPVEELAIERRPPPLTRVPRSIDQVRPEDVQMFIVGGDLNTARLVLDKTMRLRVAMKIIEMLKEDADTGGSFDDPLRVSLSDLPELPDDPDADEVPHAA